VGIIKRFFSLDCFLSVLTSIKESMITIENFQKELDEFLKLKLKSNFNWEADVDGMGMFINISVGSENFSDLEDEDEDE